MPTILTTDYVRPTTAARLSTLARAFIYKLPPETVRQFKVCRQLFVHRGDLAKYQPADSLLRRRKLARLAKQPATKPTTRRKVRGQRIDPAFYVTVGTAAALAECARGTIKDDCARGRIPAVMVDGQWLVLRSAAVHRPRPTTGRPRVLPLPVARG